MKNTLLFFILIALVSSVSSCHNARSEQMNAGEPSIGRMGFESSNPEVLRQTVISQQGTAPPEVVSNPVLPVDSAKSDTVFTGITLLNKGDFLQKVWNFEKSPQQWKYLGDKPAIIDFYADWCGPCRIASPILEEVYREYAGQIVVYKIDTQKERDLAAMFGVRSIPAFLYIPQNGNPSITSGIARTREDTKNMFVDHIHEILLPEIK